MTLIIAGATGYGVWPSNTLEGLYGCLAAPVDGIEIDVLMTADGHVVAHHDWALSASATRLGGAWLPGRGPLIRDLTLAELGRYDVGALRPGSSHASRHPHRRMMDDVRIPTLARLLEELAAAGGPRRRIYVEIKTDPQDPSVSPEPEAIVERVVQDLEDAGWTDRAKIIAFDWRVLRLARARAPQVETAHLTIPRAMAGQVVLDQAGRSPWLDGFDPVRFAGSELAAIAAHGGMEWSPHHADLDGARLAEAASLGLRVGPWGVSDGGDIVRLRAAGVWSLTVSGPDWG